jgi:hypothetical protein
MSMCHELLLQATACFAKNPSFLKSFLANEGMEAVAKFYASRTNNDTRSPSVAHLIAFLVKNALYALRAFEREGVCEKGFGTIEKTGLLGEFILCVPAVDPESSSRRS